MVTAMMLWQRDSVLGMSPRGIVGIIIRLVIYGIVFGMLYLIIDKAPFLTEPWKSYIKYALYVLIAIFVIYFLLGLAGS